MVESPCELVESAAPAAASRGAQPYRERLLAGMAELCAAAPRAREPRAQAGLETVFGQVLDGADLRTRAAFAARVAAAEWLAPGLARRLALDAIEVAQPVIAASPALSGEGLRTVLAQGSAEHRAAVALRPRLGPVLADAVVDTGEPLALAALAGAPSADLSAPVLRRLVEASRRLVALRAPLARHPDLYAELGRRMMDWVGEGLREDLARRFNLAEDAPPRDAAPQEADADSEDRLVGKLEASGQLRPGYLLKTLRDGRLSLFVTALSALGRLPRADVERALHSDRPDLLALACAAVGMDRSVFPTVLELVRSLNAGAPRGGGGEALEAALLVTRPQSAAEAFRAGLAGL